MLRDGEWDPAWSGGTDLNRPRDERLNYNHVNRHARFDEMEVIDTFGFTPNQAVMLVKTFNSKSPAGRLQPAGEGVNFAFRLACGLAAEVFPAGKDNVLLFNILTLESFVRDKLQAFRWVMARLVFIVYIVFSVVTLVGGFLTAPLMTWYFFGDWRFWRHWRPGLGLLPHGLRLTAMMLGHSRAFMFSVPLACPPRSVPDPSITLCRSDWRHGASCGDCSNCCKPGGKACPLLDEEQQACRGYNSFYWRYFNCGRYPSFAEEIRYYDCRKWALATPVQAGTATPADNPDLGLPVGAVRQGECA